MVFYAIFCPRFGFLDFPPKCCTGFTIYYHLGHLLLSVFSRGFHEILVCGSRFLLLYKKKDLTPPETKLFPRNANNDGYRGKDVVVVEGDSTPISPTNSLSGALIIPPFEASRTLPCSPHVLLPLSFFQWKSEGRRWRCRVEMISIFVLNYIHASLLQSSCLLASALAFFFFAQGASESEASLMGVVTRPDVSVSSTQAAAAEVAFAPRRHKAGGVYVLCKHTVCT